MRTVLLLLFSTLLGQSTALAGPYEDARAAYERKDNATALSILRPLAAQGHASARRSLGTMYFQGAGVSQDYAEAMKWAKLAAEQGDAGAQSNVGAMYYHGLGVRKDYAEAVKWFRLSAVQGDEEAQYGLGLSYLKGEGVKQDNVKARMWFNLASAAGSESAATVIQNTAELITPRQIVEAEKLARDCKARKFKRCD